MFTINVWKFVCGGYEYKLGAFYQDLYEMHPVRTNQYRIGNL